MDGQLVQVCLPSHFPPELDSPVEFSSPEVAELRAEVHRLQAENLELRMQAGYWQSRYRDAQKRITALEKKVEQLEGEKRQLQADLFGRRSETKPLKDRSNHLDDPQDDSKQPKRKRGQQPENHGPKRRDCSRLPVREEFVDIPPEQCVCPDCGQPLRLRSDTEDSEQIEIDVRAYRRKLRRRRYERTCTCEGSRTFTAPPPPKLIPKGRYGISLWVEILLDKYFTYRPTERLLASWRLLGLNLAAGTVTDGLQRLELLLRPIYEAIKQRNPRGDLHQGDETRWPVFVRLEGKEGHGWWLWLIKGLDTVAYLLDPTRSHTVPENHYGVESRGVLVVDRYSAYKAMIWVKDGVILLGSCTAGLHPGGQGLAQVQDVGLGMAAADSRALPAERQPVGGGEGLGGVRGSGRLPAAGRGRDENTDGDRTGPGGSCTNLPESSGKPAIALGRADAVRGCPADPDGQQRLRTTCARPCGGAEELLRFGFPMEWSSGGGVVLDLRHAVDVEAQSSEMADVVLRALRGVRGQGPGEYPTVLAVEPERRAKEGVRERRTPSRG